MPIITDNAIAMRRLDYSETSQIIVFFTREHGQVRAIAKGIKRSTRARFAVGVDLLDVGSLTLSTRTDRSAALATLTEWKQTRALGGLREKLERLHAAQYAVEITGALTQEWDPHPPLFDALLALLVDAAGAADVLGPLMRFQLSLLRAVGSQPRFDACVCCGRADNLTHFSAFEGGVVCAQCEPRLTEKRRVSRPTLLSLQRHDEANPSGPFNLLNYYISHLSGRAPLLAATLARVVRRPAPGS